MTRRAIVADLDRCTGCLTCVVACKEENHLPAGMSFIRLVQVGPHGDFPELSMYYLPVACQQCGRPACAASCPEDAIARTEAGVVAVEVAKCTGCGACVEGCPYGAIVFDPATNIARKCELCAATVPAGRAPACVAACPGKALRIVDADQAETEATGAQRRTYALKPGAGTEPVGRFILARQEWRDLC